MFGGDKVFRLFPPPPGHRKEGGERGWSDALSPPIADRSCLVDGTPGVEIVRELAPGSNDHVIKKHRYSAFHSTDLDLILREWGITTVIVSGTTTENCCHAPGPDAMFTNSKWAFLSSVTDTL